MSQVWLRAPTADDPSSTTTTNPFPAAPPGPAPPRTGPAPVPTPPAGSPLSSYQQDAVAYLQALLEDYGLGSLSGWAYEQVVAGNSPEMIVQLLRERPEYKERFHVIFQRQQRGLAPMSPAQVISYENQARQMARRAGLPQDFVSQAMIDEWMVGDVSLAEAADRIEIGRTYLYQTDPTTRAQLTALYGEGNLVAHWLDPDAALPLIQRQLTAARGAGASIRSGYGQLSTAEAEMLADLGITPEQATAAFGDLVSARELFTPLPGEAADTIVRNEQLAAAFSGDRLAQERIERQARARRAVFGGGGSFATSQEGFAGLGSADS